MESRKKVAFRKKRQQNRFGMILVAIAMLMLLGVVGFKSVGLRERQNEYKETEARLLEEIEKENQRTEDLKDLETYTKTKKYAEEVAKEKLGLVYQDEIIFKYEN